MMDPVSTVRVAPDALTSTAPLTSSTTIALAAAALPSGPETVQPDEDSVNPLASATINSLFLLADRISILPVVVWRQSSEMRIVPA
jgi:hypothetical protein